MDDSNETASTGGSVKGNYLAAIIQPVLAAAVEKTDIESANTEETAVEDSESAAAQTQGTEKVAGTVQMEMQIHQTTVVQM